MIRLDKFMSFYVTKLIHDAVTERYLAPPAYSGPIKVASQPIKVSSTKISSTAEIKGSFTFIISAACGVLNCLESQCCLVIVSEPTV